ncbi:MAG TPA: aspartate aminotransferase family protein [Flavobacteriales bacterium]|nr:aspartate aminotransferase family protein [Flavobacteriales bacterium]
MSEALLRDGLAQTTLHPLGLRVSHAQGSRITLENGKEIIDFISGIGASSFGHGHPEIVKAIHTQVDKHLHVMVYGEMRQRAQDEAARQLLQLMPDNLNSVYFVNSGAEAIDAAMKLVRRVTNRRKIIAVTGGYHGNTFGALSVSSNAERKAPFAPLVGDIDLIEWNEMHGLRAIDASVAGVIVETIQGDAGVRIPDAAWLQAIRKKCTQVGAHLVLDEIQCGFGRTGCPFAFEHFGIVPDHLCLGKALGGGMPIGALVSNKNYLQQFAHSPSLGHITTFGGHPVPCAASAVASCLLKEIDWERVEHVGAMIESNLKSCNQVQSIRRKGLYIAVELENTEVVNNVVQSALANGVLIFYFLSTPSAFRIAPPLNINDNDLNEAIDTLTRCIKRCGS